MRQESVIHRVLGAVRFVDGNTGLQISSPLAVEAHSVRFVRNRTGYYVIWSAPQLEAHTKAFRQPPDNPALGSVAIELKVTDPKGWYLPRRCTFQLPRDPDPQNADQQDSLFRPVDVPLFPSPTAGTAPGWAVIRAMVTAEDTDRRLPGALIRVLRTSDSELLARGLSDWRGRVRGEAMVVVPGIPITTWGDGNGDNGDGNNAEDTVLVTQIPVTLEVVFDPQFGPETGDVPDPDDLEARQADLPSNTIDVQLASGQTLAMTLTVPLT